MKKKIFGIGKSGSFTSIVTKKSILKKIIGGSYNECQKNIDEEIINNKIWLQLTKVLQNIRGKGIATMIGKIETKEIVVKVQLFEQSNSEFSIQSKLSEIPGFIKYICIFTCDGNKEYIETFSNVNEQTRICKVSGDKLGIIIMPYYRKGSLEDCIRTLSKDELKNILTTIISNYFNAYRTINFTHGDFFCKNIVLDEANPIIIDFEKSQFDNPRKCDIFWNDLDNICIDSSRNQYLSVKMYDIARVVTIHRAYNQEPTETIIDDLIKQIKNI